MTETTRLPVIPDSRQDDLYKLENIKQSQLTMKNTGSSPTNYETD
jgi:hypothetical protein